MLDWMFEERSEVLFTQWVTLASGEKASCHVRVSHRKLMSDTLALEYRRRESPMRTRKAVISCLVIGIVLAFSGGAALGDDTGESGYQKHCAVCHGIGGEADTPAGKALKVGSIKGLALEAKKVSQSVRKSTSHSTVTSKLSDAELAAISKFVSTL
jgi:mono/diheme cytochrome c family protein